MEDKLDIIIELLREILDTHIQQANSYNGFRRWDEAQEEFLLDAYNSNSSIVEIIKLIEEQFGIIRSPGAISSRLKKLGVI